MNESQTPASWLLRQAIFVAIVLVIFFAWINNPVLLMLDLSLPLMVFPALLIWLVWLLLIVRITRLASSDRDRLTLYLLPFGCQFLLTIYLSGQLMIHERSGIFQWYGAESLFLALAAVFFPWWGWGLSPRDDVAERGNRYAGWAIGGAMLGLTLSFVGLADAYSLTKKSNYLHPVSFLCLLSLLAFLAFFVLWGILEKAAHLSEAIAVERDGRAALRLTAILVALGRLVGRSFPALVEGIPKLLDKGEWVKPLLAALGPFALILAAVVIERGLKAYIRSPGRGPNAIDFVIVLFYLGGAGLWSSLSK